MNKRLKIEKILNKELNINKNQNILRVSKRKITNELKDITNKNDIINSEEDKENLNISKNKIRKKKIKKNINNNLKKSNSVLEIKKLSIFNQMIELDENKNKSVIKNKDSKKNNKIKEKSIINIKGKENKENKENKKLNFIQKNKIFRPKKPVKFKPTFKKL